MYYVLGSILDTVLTAVKNIFTKISALMKLICQCVKYKINMVIKVYDMVDSDKY